MSNPYAPPDPNKPRPTAPQGPPPPGRYGPPDRRYGPPNAPRPPERTPATPEEQAQVSRLVIRAGLLMLALLIAVQLPIPWLLVAPLVGLAGVVTSIRAIALANKVNARGSVIPMMVVGIVLTGMFTFTTTARFLVWDAEVAKQECLAGALTVQAQNSCQADYEKAVEDRLPSRTPSPSGTP